MTINTPLQKPADSAGSQRPQPALYFGRLMTPAQVNAATACYPKNLFKVF